MQIKRIALGGIIKTVIMFSGCSTTVQNLAIGEEKTLETGKTEQESVTEKDINMNEKELRKFIQIIQSLNKQEQAGVLLMIQGARLLGKNKKR